MPSDLNLISTFSPLNPPNSAEFVTDPPLFSLLFITHITPSPYGILEENLSVCREKNVFLMITIVAYTHYDIVFHNDSIVNRLSWLQDDENAWSVFV